MSVESKKNERFMYRLAMLSGISALILVFIMFNSPFNINILGSDVSGFNMNHFDFLKMGFDDSSEIVEGGNYFMFMLLCLPLAIILFLVQAFISGHKEDLNFVGIIAASLCLVYSGLNYLTIHYINSNLGIFSSLGGLSFGLSGWLSLLVGLGCLVLIIFRE